MTPDMKGYSTLCERRHLHLQITLRSIIVAGVVPAEVTMQDDCCLMLTFSLIFGRHYTRNQILDLKFSAKKKNPQRMMVKNEGNQHHNFSFLFLNLIGTLVIIWLYFRTQCGGAQVSLILFLIGCPLLKFLDCHLCLSSLIFVPFKLVAFLYLFFWVVCKRFYIMSHDISKAGNSNKLLPTSQSRI